MRESKFRLDPVAVLALAFALGACTSEPLDEADCEAETGCDDGTGGPASGGTGGSTAGTGGTGGTSGASGTGTGGSTAGGQCVGLDFLEQSCPSSTEPNACKKCIAEECCDSEVEIYGGGPATDLGQCWLECTTPECEDACYAAFPDGVEGFGAYDACTTVNCFSKDECPVQPCTKCQATRCPCEYAACVADVDCHLIRQCVGGCNEDTACFDACIAEHPAGYDKLEVLLVCLSQNCIDDC